MHALQLDESLYTITPLQEEASTRRYFHATRGNESFVICRDQSINRDFILLTEYLQEQGVRVPHILGVNEESGTIYQEFCGWQDFSSHSSEDYPSTLEETVGLILKLQSLKNPPEFVRNRMFDCEKLQFEANLTWENYQRWQSQRGRDRKIPEAVRIFTEQGIDSLGKQAEWVFAHRDFHCRNLLIHPITQETVLIDYQDARMGTPYYDLASILYDAYKPIPTATRVAWLDRFLTQTNRNTSQDKRNYYLQAYQRSHKALGTYLIQVGDKKNPKFRPSLYHCLTNLQEICNLGEFGGTIQSFFKTFQETIQEDEPQ